MEIVCIQVVQCKQASFHGSAGSANEAALTDTTSPPPGEKIHWDLLTSSIYSHNLKSYSLRCQK